MQEAVAAVAVAVVDVAGIAVGDIVWVAVTAVERRTVGLLLIYKAWKNLFADRSFLVSFSLDLMFMTTVKQIMQFPITTQLQYKMYAYNDVIVHLAVEIIPNFSNLTLLFT